MHGNPTHPATRSDISGAGRPNRVERETRRPLRGLFGSAMFGRQSGERFPLERDAGPGPGQYNTPEATLSSSAGLLAF